MVSTGRICGGIITVGMWSRAHFSAVVMIAARFVLSSCLLSKMARTGGGRYLSMVRC